ncbi:MASE1 domain-containing protein [Streptomyces sp. NPDC006997]|uniref:MASE1 domain-containing protein n=1 Tax=Streptomyces sp. NPDC006997 TaxID=3155356 RepID=UPI0033CD97AA
MAAVVATRVPRRALTPGLQALAVAACYYAAGRLGLLRQLAVESAVFTPIWPATGVALAALLVLGPRCWPGIALGAFLVILSLAGLDIHPAALITVAGSTAAPVFSYLLLRRVGFRPELERLRDGIALVVLGALVGTLISATTGVSALVLTDQLEATAFGAVWFAWWVGDAMGVLVVTPLLLVAAKALTRPRPRLRRWPEAVALLVATLVIVPLATRSSVSLLFLVCPLLIWAALSFQVAGSMLCALFTSVMATVAATDEVGPFQGLTHVEVMSKLQAFNGSMALIALLLSAVIAEQRNTRRSVEHACQELVEVLEHLTASEPQARWPPPGTDLPEIPHLPDLPTKPPDDD